MKVLEKVRVVRRADSAVGRPFDESEKAKTTMKYEISHDVLATAVRTWREKHEKEKAEEKAKVDAEKEKAAAEKREAEQRRQVVWTRWVAVAFFILFVAAVGAFLLACSWYSARQKDLRQACWGSFNQADRLFQLGQWAEGILHLEHAVKFDPGNAVVAQRFFQELTINRAQASASPTQILEAEGEVFQAVFSPDAGRVLIASKNFRRRCGMQNLASRSGGSHMKEWYTGRSSIPTVNAF